MKKILHVIPWLLFLILSSCDGGEFANSTAEQIESALAQCNVQIKDYARDRDLGGRYLIMYHKEESNHKQKMECVSSYLEELGVMATAIYPEPVNREGLY